MDLLVSVGLPLALVVIMLSLGIGLRPADFARVATRPAAFAVGAAMQVLLVPVVTYLVVIAFGFSGELAVGFMILAACPGGVTTNLLTRLARGDVALSVSLTAVVSLLSVVTVPAVLGIAYAAFTEGGAGAVDLTGTALTMFGLTAVPIGIGMALRAAAPGAMARAEPWLVRVSAALFALILVAAVAANLDVLMANVARLGPALLLLPVLLVGLGWLVPRVLRLGTEVSRTVAIEAGIQNGTLGIAVAGLLTGGEGFGPLTLPAALYGITMYVVGLPAVALLRRG